MKTLKVYSLSEESLRRIVCKFNTLNYRKNSLFDIVNSVYEGRLTNLIYSLISNHSEGYYSTENYFNELDLDKCDLIKIIGVPSKHDVNSKIIVRDVYVTNREPTLPYVSELGLILETFNLLDNKDIQLEVLDLIYTFLKVVDLYVFEPIIDKGDNYTVMNIVNNKTNIELVLLS